MCCSQVLVSSPGVPNLSSNSLEPAASVFLKKFWSVFDLRISLVLAPALSLSLSVKHIQCPVLMPLKFLFLVCWFCLCAFECVHGHVCVCFKVTLHSAVDVSFCLVLKQGSAHTRNRKPPHSTVIFNQKQIASRIGAMDPVFCVCMSSPCLWGLSRHPCFIP